MRHRGLRHSCRKSFGESCVMVSMRVECWCTMVGSRSLVCPEKMVDVKRRWVGG